MVLSAGSSVGVGATAILSRLSDTNPGGVESPVTGPVLVDSSVTSSVVATVLTMDPDGSVGTGGTGVLLGNGGGVEIILGQSYVSVIKYNKICNYYHEKLDFNNTN